MDMNLSKLQREWRTKELGLLQSMGLQRIGHDSETEHSNLLLSPEVILLFEIFVNDCKYLLLTCLNVW